MWSSWPLSARGKVFSQGMPFYSCNSCVMAHHHFTSLMPCHPGIVSIGWLSSWMHTGSSRICHPKMRFPEFESVISPCRSHFLCSSTIWSCHNPSPLIGPRLRLSSLEDKSFRSWCATKKNNSCLWTQCMRNAAWGWLNGDWSWQAIYWQKAQC